MLDGKYTSKIKINSNLFCTSLGFYYLCTQIRNNNIDNAVNISTRHGNAFISNP